MRGGIYASWRMTYFIFGINMNLFLPRISFLILQHILEVVDRVPSIALRRTLKEQGQSKRWRNQDGQGYTVELDYSVL